VSADPFDSGLGDHGSEITLLLSKRFKRDPSERFPSPTSCAKISGRQRSNSSITCRQISMLPIQRYPVEVEIKTIGLWYMFDHIEQYDEVIRMFRAQLPKPRDRGPYRTVID